jgi:hypothetical protein
MAHEATPSDVRRPGIRLVADGETVLDVPAKLAARVYSRGHGRKTGKDDAVPVGLAALDGTGGP